MSKLTRDAKELVKEARRGGDPSDADQARIRAALTARFGVPAPEGASSISPIVKPNGQSRWSWGAKVFAGIGIALVTGANAFDTEPEAAPLEIAAPVHPITVVSHAITEPAPVVLEARALSSEATSPRATPAPKAKARISAPMRAKGSIAEEIALIGRAHDALQAGNPEEALARLDEHADRFPTGALAEERASERVLALCASGRVAQARTERERFLREHPESPAVTRVRASCFDPTLER
jgi:hypothetical protein